MWSTLIYLCSIVLFFSYYYPLLRELVSPLDTLSSKPCLLAPLSKDYAKSKKAKIIPGKYIVHFKQQGTFDSQQVITTSEPITQLGILSALEAQQVHRFWLLSEISKSGNSFNQLEHDYELGTVFSGYSGQFDDAMLTKIRTSSIVDLVEPVQKVWVSGPGDEDEEEDVDDDALFDIETMAYVTLRELGELPQPRVPYMSAYAPTLQDRARYQQRQQLKMKGQDSGDDDNNSNMTCRLQTDAPWGLVRLSHRIRPVSYDGRYAYPSNAGSDVDVYIIDTGIHVEHEEFEGRARWGVTVPEGDVDQDGNGHGTHCAGTIGSRAYGVAKNCSLIAVKVLRSDGYGSNADVIKGIEYVYNQHIISGKRRPSRQTVVNMSLGGGKSLALEHAVNAAVSVGVHFCVAAGNDNEDACNYSPAGAKEAITVGASTSQDEVAYFSNIGRCVDIFAPGHQILSTWIGSTKATNTISGTSMASPHVAGAVAHLLSGPMKGATPAELKTELRKLATRNTLMFVPYDTVNALLHVHACDAASSSDD